MFILKLFFFVNKKLKKPLLFRELKLTKKKNKKKGTTKQKKKNFPSDLEEY
jgi:hypothetical protein